LATFTTFVFDQFLLLEPGDCLFLPIAPRRAEPHAERHTTRRTKRRAQRGSKCRLPESQEKNQGAKSQVPRQAKDPAAQMVDKSARCGKKTKKEGSGYHV
jgi:hypothetical protein